MRWNLFTLSIVTVGLSFTACAEVPETDGAGGGDLGMQTESVVAADMGQMFITRAELASKPMSGAGWTFLKSRADMSSWGTVSLSDQNSLTQSYVLAGALVYARTGDTRYRTKVIEYVRRAPGTEIGSSNQLLNLARTLYGYVVAADLVGMPMDTPCANGQTWRQFLQGIRTKVIPGNSRWATLEFTSSDSASNWGAYALPTHLAVSYALNDTAAIARDTAIFRRYLGDTASTAAAFRPSSAYNHNGAGATWDMLPTMRVGINPTGDSRRSGAIIEDILRDSTNTSRACCTPVQTGITYSEEAMDGMLSTAQLLRAHGNDVRQVGSESMRRAWEFIVTHGGPGPYSLTRFLPYAINYLYGTNYRTETEDRPYRHLGYGAWLFSGSISTAPADDAGSRTDASTDSGTVQTDAGSATDAVTTADAGTTSAPTFRGASSNAGGTVSSLAIARPTGVLAGDVLVATLTYRGNGAIGAPAGWSMVRNTANGVTHMTSFVRTASGSEPSSYTFTVPLAAGFCGGISAFGGVTSVDASNGAYGTDTSIELPPVTTTGSNRVIVAAYGQIGAVSYSPAAGYTERFDVKTPGGTYLASASQSSRVQSASGSTGSPVATASGTGGGWMAQVIALK